MELPKKKILYPVAAKWGAVLGVPAVALSDVINGRVTRLFDLPYLLGAALGGAVIGILIAKAANIRRV